MDDEQIAALKAAAEIYRAADQNAQTARAALDALIQALKRGGAGFAELTEHSGLARGTIQNIVGNDPADVSYWRRRCQRRTKGESNCDEVWPINTGEWCPTCLEMLARFPPKTGNR